MSNFFGYRGEIARIAIDELRSDLFAYLLAGANYEDLRTISLECRGDVLHIAEDMNGCEFLKRLFERLDVLTLVYELQSILEAFVGDQRFITSLCRSEFCLKTLFSLLDLLLEKKQEVIGSILPTLLMCNENVEQFLDHLFMSLTKTELEPIVNQLIGGSFTELARHDHGHKNLFLVIQSVGYARVITLLPPDFCSSAFDKKGNQLLQTFVTHPQKTIRSAFISKLSGRFDTLSRDKYANFLVKAEQ